MNDTGIHVGTSQFLSRWDFLECLFTYLLIFQLFILQFLRVLCWSVMYYNFKNLPDGIVLCWWTENFFPSRWCFLFIFSLCSLLCWHTFSCWPGWESQLSLHCLFTCTSMCGPSAGTLPWWRGQIFAWTCVSSVGRYWVSAHK